MTGIFTPMSVGQRKAGNIQINLTLFPSSDCICTLSPNLSYLRRNVSTIPIVSRSCFESLAIMEGRSWVLLSRVLPSYVCYASAILCHRHGILGNECHSNWNGTSLIIGNFKMVIMRTPMRSDSIVRAGS